jgi:hypothetical protein
MLRSQLTFGKLVPIIYSQAMIVKQAIKSKYDERNYP